MSVEIFQMQDPYFMGLKSRPMPSLMHHLCLVAVFITFATQMSAQERAATKEAAPGRADSGTPEKALEVIRAKRAGTLVALFVKPGDFVSKNQLLGHTELDAAKLNVDMARANLEATGTLDQMFWQYQALITTREEVEEAVRKRTSPKSRLQYAIAMENWAKGQYQAQQEIKKVQRINYEHCQLEYDARFFHSPIDGVITEVKVAVAQAVGLGAAAFTVTNDTRAPILAAAPVMPAAASMQIEKSPTLEKSSVPANTGEATGMPKLSAGSRYPQPAVR